MGYVRVDRWDEVACQKRADFGKESEDRGGATWCGAIKGRLDAIMEEGRSGWCSWVEAGGMTGNGLPLLGRERRSQRLYSPLYMNSTSQWPLLAVPLHRLDEAVQCADAPCTCQNEACISSTSVDREDSNVSSRISYNFMYFPRGFRSARTSSASCPRSIPEIRRQFLHGFVSLHSDVP